MKRCWRNTRFAIIESSPLINYLQREQKEFQKKRESPHDEGSHVILQIIAWVVGKISLKQKV